MVVRKRSNDISYCNGSTVGGTRVGCVKKETCKRFVGNYAVYDKVSWYIMSSECINNKHNMFVPLTVEDGYKMLNSKLSTDKIK